MANLEYSFVCTYCSEILDDPMTLNCCQSNICSSHFFDYVHFCPICFTEEFSVQKNSQLKQKLDAGDHLGVETRSLKINIKSVLNALKNESNELCARLDQFSEDYSNALNSKRQLLEKRLKDGPSSDLSNLLEEIKKEEILVNTQKNLIKCVDNVNEHEMFLEKYFLTKNLNKEHIKKFEQEKASQLIEIRLQNGQFQYMEHRVQSILKRIADSLKSTVIYP